MPLAFENRNHDQNAEPSSFSDLSNFSSTNSLSLSLNLKQLSLLIYTTEVTVWDEISGLSIGEKLAEEEEWSGAEIVFVAEDCFRWVIFLEDYICVVKQVCKASDDDCQASQCFNKSLIALDSTFRLQFRL